MKTILDFYSPKVGGVLLDQPQPTNGKKRQAVHVVFSKYHNILCELEGETQKYGFTGTFNMKKFKNDDPTYMHRLVIAKLLKSTSWKGVKYIIFPEFDDNGNLHYHGLIWDVYEVKFVKCLKMWRQTFGFAKPELNIKHYICNKELFKCKRQPKSWCWKHYITKSVGKTGLWTISNIPLTRTSLIKKT